MPRTPLADCACQWHTKLVGELGLEKCRGRHWQTALASGTRSWSVSLGLEKCRGRHWQTALASGTRGWLVSWGLRSAEDATGRLRLPVAHDPIVACQGIYELCVTPARRNCCSNFPNRAAGRCGFPRATSPTCRSTRCFPRRTARRRSRRCRNSPSRISCGISPISRRRTCRWIPTSIRSAPAR